MVMDVWRGEMRGYLVIFPQSRVVGEAVGREQSVGRLEGF